MKRPKRDAEREDRIHHVRIRNTAAQHGFSVRWQEGSLDAERDWRSLEIELILSDLEVIEKRLERLEKDMKRASNPLLPKDSPERVKLDEDRARHGLSVGARPSDRVHRFLDAAGILERPARVNPNKAEPGEKAKERAEARAAREAEAAAAPAEEAPAFPNVPTPIGATLTFLKAPATGLLTTCWWMRSTRRAWSTAGARTSWPRRSIQPRSLTAG